MQVLATGAAVLAAAAPHPCPKTFTVPMGIRAAKAVYAGSRPVTRREHRMLRRILRCQRNPNARWYVRRVERRQRRLWEGRRLYSRALYGPVLASWYDDAGATACGFHATYGFASLTLPCGARVRMRGPGGSIIAVMQDRGPYVGGRTFDLNPALKAALGCSDLCEVYWR